MQNKQEKIQSILINEKINIKTLFTNIKDILINNKSLSAISETELKLVLKESKNNNGLFLVRAKALWNKNYLPFMSSNNIMILISSSSFKKLYIDNVKLNTFNANPHYFLKSKKVLAQTFLKSVLINSYKYSFKDNIQLQNISFKDRVQNSFNKMTVVELRKTLKKQYSWVIYEYYNLNKKEYITYLIENLKI